MDRNLTLVFRFIDCPHNCSGPILTSPLNLRTREYGISLNDCRWRHPDLWRGANKDRYTCTRPFKEVPLG